MTVVELFPAPKWIYGLVYRAGMFSSIFLLTTLIMAKLKYKVTKSYPQSSFRRILKGKSSFSLADDNTDMVIYLIYMDYLNTLMAEASSTGLTERSIDQAQVLVMKRFRG